MKKVFSTICLAVLAATVSLANASDKKGLSINEKYVGYLPTVSAMSSDSTSVADVVIFYQPSYAASYGEYEIYRRVERWFETANQSYAAHGLDLQLSIKDMVPVVSVPDTAPYMDVVDEDGNIIQDGAEYLFSLAALNAGQPEYEIYQTKWKADLVVYVRERRDGDDILGSAGIGGEYSSVLDNGIDPTTYTTLAHEVGHSIGMNHEEANAHVGPEYARAWQCGGKTTIMFSGATEANTLHHYSSPDISFGGEVCGDEAVANNARVLQENFGPTTQRRSGVDSLGQVSFAADAFNGNEVEGVTVSLVRDGDISQAASVKVFIENGSAVWGEDFTEAFVVADFTEGESTAEVVFPMINDADDEDMETARVFLKFPYRLALGNVNEANVFIENGNNGGFAGQFSVLAGSASVNEGDVVDLTVTRSGGVGEVVVNVVTLDGAAIAGNDFVELNEALVFAEGEVEKALVLTTINDEVFEESEALTVSISSPSTTAEYGVKETAITVIDDDVNTQPQVGVFSLVVSNSTVEENVGTFTVTINRENGSEGEANLRLYTVDGGQVAGTDYQAVDQQIVFADGETQKEVQITVIDETIDDNDSGFRINLEGDGLEISVGELTIIIKDNDNSNENNGTDDNRGSSSGGGSMGMLSVLLFGLVAFRNRLTKLNANKKPI